MGKVLQIVPQGAHVVYQCAVGRGLKLDEVLRTAGRHVVVLPGDGEPYKQNGWWRDRSSRRSSESPGRTRSSPIPAVSRWPRIWGSARAASNVPPLQIGLVTADSIVENLLDAAVIAPAYAALH